MGLTLSLAGIIGVQYPAVASTLKAYAGEAKGKFPDGFGETDYLKGDIGLWLGKNGTTVVYGETFSQWDHASQYLSRHLKAPVFSFYMHDDDVWMYQLYMKGELVSKFNPKPLYFDQDEDVTQWEGDAAIIAQVVPGVTVASIKNYLVFCTEENGEERAYPNDEFARWDFWQIVDFMEKLGLGHPFADVDEDIEGKYESVSI